MEHISDKEYKEFLNWKYRKSLKTSKNKSKTNLGIPISIFVLSIVTFLFMLISMAFCPRILDWHNSIALCQIDLACIAGAIPIFILSLVLMNEFRQNRGLSVAIISVDSSGMLVLICTFISSCFAHGMASDQICTTFWIMYTIIITIWAALIPLASILLCKALKARKK